MRQGAGGRGGQGVAGAVVVGGVDAGGVEFVELGAVEQQVGAVRRGPQVAALDEGPLRPESVQGSGGVALVASSMTSMSTSSRTSSRFGVTTVASGNSSSRRASSADG